MTACSILHIPWTQAQLEQIAAYVSTGSSIPVACEAAGVRWSTAKHWMRRGGQEEAPYDEFYCRLRRAQAMHEVMLNGLLSREAKQNWRAAAFLKNAREHRAEQRQRHRLRALRARDPNALSPSDERTILCYPVPAPLGAEPAQLDSMRAANAPMEEEI